MLFNSLLFVKFFLVVVALYYLLERAWFQVPLLIVASFIFYSADNPWLVLLLLFSIALNAGFALAIGRWAHYSLLVLGVGLNLAVLAAFKYGPLILSPDQMKLPLPIGISFFTFEGIMILVDRWHRRQEERPDFFSEIRRVALLMSFFPHLVSGPIVKARDFFPQIQPKRRSDIDWELAFRSLTTGYFLKLVVADNLRELTQTLTYPYFENDSTLLLSCLLLGYSAQIFADFAGYSLMAIGLAAILGYRLPENFNFPYIATSFSEFWQRWHISLSSFLREYLYIPLGGNRHGSVRTYLNIMIVMGLGGLWHGAAWSYAVWGLMHGLALVVERMMPFSLKGPFWRWLRRLGVFVYVSFCWLLFKMPNFEHVVFFLKVYTHDLDGDNDLRCMIGLLVCSTPVLLYHLAYLSRSPRLDRYAYLAYGLMLFMLLTNSGPPGNFIYFQF